MSIMSCNNCGQYIDTDNPELGVWIAEDGKPDSSDPVALICDSCAQDTFTEAQIEAYENGE